MVKRGKVRRTKGPLGGEKCKVVKDSDVWVEDRFGSRMVLGAIVEIVEHQSDRYRGLFYVVGFETGGMIDKILLAETPTGKWDIKVSKSRVVLRCNDPIRRRVE